MSIRKGQARLRKISKDIENDLPLSKKDKDFLCSALMQIASGEDAELALDVKAKKVKENLSIPNKQKHN